MQRPRRGSRLFGGAQLCAFMAAILLLLSLFLLHTRLGSFRLRLLLQPVDSVPAVHLLSDDDPDSFSGDDRIDELDRPESDDDAQQSKTIDQILDEVDADESSDPVEDSTKGGPNQHIGLFWDHVIGVTRRSFDKDHFASDLDPSDPDEDLTKFVFASDDQPLDEGTRTKLDAIRSVEDVLLLKSGWGPSILRDGWAHWFEKKGDFLRKDRMFRPNLDLLNAFNNPMLQDPDMPGVTVLTRGDKMMQKALWGEKGKIPFGQSRSDPKKNLNLGDIDSLMFKGVGQRKLGEIAINYIVDRKNIVINEPPIHLGLSGFDRMRGVIREMPLMAKQRKMSIWRSRKLTIVNVD